MFLCAPDLAILLPEADGAFVGRWVDRADTGDGMAAVTFEVERVVEGRVRAEGHRPDDRGRVGLVGWSGSADLGRAPPSTRHGWGLGIEPLLEVPPERSSSRSEEISRPPVSDVAAVGAGWSLGLKGLLGAIAVLVIVLLALAWFARRRASEPGESGGVA